MIACLSVGPAAAARPADPRETQSGWQVVDGEGDALLAFVRAHARSTNGGIDAPMYLVNVWASWCAPCLLELPALDRLAAVSRRDDVEIVALSLDGAGLAAVRDTFRRAGVRRLDPLADPSRASTRSLDLQSLPTTVLLDGYGRVVARRQGRVDWDARGERRALHELIERFARRDRSRSEASPFPMP